MAFKKIDYNELLRVLGYQDYKSWPRLRLVHAPPNDENEKK